MQPGRSATQNSLLLGRHGIWLAQCWYWEDFIWKAMKGWIVVFSWSASKDLIFQNARSRSNNYHISRSISDLANVTLSASWMALVRSLNVPKIMGRRESWSCGVAEASTISFLGRGNLVSQTLKASRWGGALAGVGAYVALWRRRQGERAQLMGRQRNGATLGIDHG